MSECDTLKTTKKDDFRGNRVASSLSLPAFHILSDRDKKPVRDLYTEVQLTQREKKAKPNVMSTNTTSVEIHHPPSRPSHTARTRRSSRHERHKCHKSKHRAVESLQITNQNLLERINELKRENYILSRKLNASVTSLDSGLSQNEILSPFELDVNTAYQHVKNENTKLSSEIERYRTHCNDLKIQVERLEKDNKELEGDVSMLKNLVYKLNLELERYQNNGGNGSVSTSKASVLPENYQKNFLKPVLPLLRAYSEAVQEKNEMIENFEGDLKKFSVVFNDILKENEKLYMELEKKMNTVEGDALNEVKMLRKDLEMAKQENSLLLSQIELEQEKLAEVHSVYRMKVAEVLKQNAAVNESLQEQKADLYMMKGKYSILKQEFERLKLDNDSKVPMAVHAASIGECKRLFQDLKNEYEAQKQHHLATIAEQEQVLTKLRKQSEEKLFEKSAGDEENSRRRFELANEGELTNIRKQLRESNTKVEELSSKLANTKKQLHKAMAFAEDIVREQESLLLQLHAKQKENNFMVSHFGSLKNQLKNVEKGAQEGLNSVEEKMRGLEMENSKLSTEVRKMRALLKEKEDVIARLEHPKDVWAIKEGGSGSENESGTDSEDISKEFSIRYGEDGETKCQHQKSASIDYDSGEYNLPESDYSNEDDRCCVKVMPEGRCSHEKEHYYHDCDMADYRKACLPTTKPHSCKQVKLDNFKRRNSKEEVNSVMIRFSPRRYSKSCSTRIKGHWECEKNIHRCDEWCNRLQMEEARNDRKPLMLSCTKPYKRVHPLKKDRPTEWKCKGQEEYHTPKCCCHKHKKKVLDSYEELPAVDEALERRSDETYKASSYTKFPINIGDSQTNFPQNKNDTAEIYQRTPSWFLCDKISGTAVNKSLPYEIYPERTTKTRSKRTRINRKSIKWMKALVHPVVEGSRKEKVGVMILERNGPEYYSKYSNKKLCIPFRKTRSFQEGPTKSYDMPFNFEPKEISFSASDPGRKPRNEPRTPEEDNKIEEKIADFDKNVEKLVKNMEEKFLESISKDNFQDDTKKTHSPNKADLKIGSLEEKKTHKLMPRELLSSRVPKSTRKYDRDVFAFNVESKTMAESLNERAKQFRLGQKSTLSDLEKKFPPKAVDKETQDANLTLWGMNDLRELREVSDAGGEGDGNDFSLRIPIRRNSECTETQSKGEADEKPKDKPAEEVDKGKEPEKTPEKGEKPGKDHVLLDIFKNLVNDGSAITEKESEKLQKMLQNIGYEPELTSSEMDSKTSCETIREKGEESKRESPNRKHSEDCPSNRTVKNADNQEHKWKSGKISNRKDTNAEKLKIIRQALPSMAAENEAAHLKQLKMYLHNYIDSKISKSEVRGRRRSVRCKQRDTTSSDSSEVKVDASKLIDLVSNPFQRITSDMTIDMAKKLTDTLVQENSSKTAKKLVSKTRKNSEETEDVSLQCPTTSRSDGEDEVDPGRTCKYLEGLKKMRNDHLSNIIMEVKRLRELIRFVDRCNRLKL